MAEQDACPVCRRSLRLRGSPIRLTTVAGITSHSICWVMKLAPSAKAGPMVN